MQNGSSKNYSRGLEVASTRLLDLSPVKCAQQGCCEKIDWRERLGDRSEFEIINESSGRRNADYGNGRKILVLVEERNQVDGFPLVDRWDGDR